MLFYEVMIWNEVRMKQVLRLFAGVAIGAMLLTSCGSTSILSSPENVNTNLEAKDTESENEKLNIAIISGPSGVDDGNFNEDIYNGIKNFISNHPKSEVTPIREITGETDAVIETVSDIAEDYDVIVCCGFQFSGIGEIAKTYPGKKFIIVDGYPLDKFGNAIVCDNVYAMEFKEQEGGFLAGLAAALESKTKKVSVITGMPFPSNVNYQYGFESGVNYANEKYGTNVKYIGINSYAGIDIREVNVGGNYVGSFSDEDKGKEIAKELLSRGCDVIFIAAGGSGKGVLKAIKEAKNTQELLAIGCDVDQFKDGINGNNNIVLTSVLKRMHANVEKQLETILAGKFKGENAVLGADTDSIGYVKEKGRNRLSADSIVKLDEAYKLIKTGKIIPASNFNEMTPKDFIGLKQR